MKLTVDLKTDKIISVYKNDDVENTKPNRYMVQTDVVPDKKKVPKSVWRQLKDDSGNLLWEEGNNLKPLMGYEVAEEETITFFGNPEFWELKEVLELKYKAKLSNGYQSVFYDELIDSQRPYSINGINFSKKNMYGNGCFELPILVEGEVKFVGEGNAKIYLSVDGKKWFQCNSNWGDVDFKKASGILRVRIEGKLSSFYVLFNGSVTGEIEGNGMGLLGKPQRTIL